MKELQRFPWCSVVNTNTSADSCRNFARRKLSIFISKHTSTTSQRFEKQNPQNPAEKICFRTRVVGAKGTAGFVRSPQAMSESYRFRALVTTKRRGLFMY
jgi:hypothetical protein